MNKRGFTIVELLIVIVVIAILAAITIVAYNGIQNRAKQSAAQSRLTQANKKILAYAVTNSDTYPESLAQAEIDNSDNALQYTVNNSASPKTYGLTATNGSFSYYVSSTSSKPTAGGYQGHSQNGLPSRTNYAINPSAVGDTTVTTAFHYAGTPAAATRTIATDRAHNGNSSLKAVITGSGQTGAMAKTSGGTSVRVNAGEKISWSLWLYSTKAGSAIVIVEGSRVSDNGYTGSGSAAGTVNIPANTWVKASGTYTPTIDMYISQAGVYNLAVVAGDTLWADEFLIEKADAPGEYADGNTANWVWNGTENNATSTGPSV